MCTTPMCATLMCTTFKRTHAHTCTHQCIVRSSLDHLQLVSVHTHTCIYIDGRTDAYTGVHLHAHTNTQVHKYEHIHTPCCIAVCNYITIVIYAFVSCCSEKRPSVLQLRQCLVSRAPRAHDRNLRNLSRNVLCQAPGGRAAAACLAKAQGKVRKRTQ